MHMFGWFPTPRRAADFDASAAVSPAEALRQLQDSIGGSGKVEEDDELPEKGETGKNGGGAGDDDDETPAPPEKKESLASPAKGSVEELEPGTPKPGTKEEFKSSPLLDKILSKYGNDPDKFAEALFHQQNSVADLHKKIDALTASAEEEEDLIHPDAATIDEDIEGFKASIADNEADQAGLVKKGEQIREQLAELRGELKHAEPEEKRGIEAQIEAKKERLDTLLDKWKSLDKANQGVRREMKYALRRKEELKTEVENAKLQRKDTREKAKQWQTEQREIFDTAVQDLSKVYPKATSDDIDYLHGVIKAEASLFLRARKESDPAIDLKKFVDARGEVHAKKLGLAKVGTLERQTTEKLKVSAAVTPREPASRRAPTPPPAVRRPSDRHLSHEDKAKQARLHAAKVLGG